MKILEWHDYVVLFVSVLWVFVGWRKIIIGIITGGRLDWELPTCDD